MFWKLFVALLRPGKHFGKHTARGPEVDFDSVVGVAVKQLRPAVVAGRNVSDRAAVRRKVVVVVKLLGGSEVANLEFVLRFGLDVNKNVVGLNVAVSDAQAVDMREPRQELVHQLLYLQKAARAEHVLLA